VFLVSIGFHYNNCLKLHLVKKIKLLFSFILVLISTIAYTQILLDGVVIDKKTKQGLPFSTIRIKDKKNVAIADEKGHFVFSYVAEKFSKLDSIQISYIGYHTLKLAIEDIKKNNTFELEEKTYTLSNIVVRPEMAADKLIEKVIQKFETNFSQDAFEQEGFYRSIVMSNDEYAGISESFIKIYSDGYNKNFSDSKYQFVNSDLIKPLFCRHSKYTIKNDSRGFIIKTPTPRGLLFTKKDLLYNTFLTSKNVKLYLYKYLTEEDNDYYVIGFAPKKIKISYRNSAYEQYSNNQISGKLYINKADLGIVKIETTNDSWSSSFERVTDKLTNHTHRYISRNISIQFAIYNFKYYMTHINSEISYEDYGWSNSKPIIVKNQSELRINNLSSYEQSAERLREEYGNFWQSGDVKIQSKLSECSFDINFWNKAEKQLTFNYQKIKKDLGEQNLFTNDNILTKDEIKEIINNYTPKGKALYYEKND